MERIKLAIISNDAYFLQGIRWTLQGHTRIIGNDFSTTEKEGNKYEMKLHIMRIKKMDYFIKSFSTDLDRKSLVMLVEDGTVLNTDFHPYYVINKKIKPESLVSLTNIKILHSYLTKSSGRSKPISIKMRIKTTIRQHEILDMYTNGFSKEYISTKLNIRKKTIDTHIHNLKRNNNIVSTAEIIKYNPRLKAEDDLKCLILS